MQRETLNNQEEWDSASISLPCEDQVMMKLIAILVAGRMGVTDSNDTNTRLSGSPDEADNTVTFVIGFGVLVLFVLAGVMASIFLCVTLKKDPFLWDPEPIPAPDPGEKPKESEISC
ncbi:uncharacterized protein [Anabrus simplex]|uniref:uncharacterized protein n=1 Tax=Anabrus simplex TaxID=316456 RepID=UPI0034DCDF69